jgi:hypothetical protein
VLSERGVEVSCSAALQYVLINRLSIEQVSLEMYARLDDIDVLSAIKDWVYHSDSILSSLSKRLVNRDLLKVRLSDEPFAVEIIEDIRKRVKINHNLSDEALSYFVFSGAIENRAYNTEISDINLLEKDGSITPISRDAHIMDIQAFSRTFRKYYLCYPE